MEDKNEVPTYAPFTPVYYSDPSVRNSGIRIVAPNQDSDGFVQLLDCRGEAEKPYYDRIRLATDEELEDFVDLPDNIWYQCPFCGSSDLKADFNREGLSSTVTCGHCKNDWDEAYYEANSSKLA